VYEISTDKDNAPMKKIIDEYFDITFVAYIPPTQKRLVGFTLDL